jgi:hypothetical protein
LPADEARDAQHVIEPEGKHIRIGCASQPFSQACAGSFICRRLRIGASVI